MTITGINQEFQSFKGGLFTESNILTAPADTTQDEDNMTLTASGDREIRLGIDFEGFAAGSANFTFRRQNGFGTFASRVRTFVWENVSSQSNLEFLVIVVDASYKIYDNNDVDILNSSSLYSFNSISNQDEVDFTVHEGNLVITSANSGLVQLVTYDVTADTFANTFYDLKIRDQFGIEEALDVTERPTTLTDIHKYNLYNQGWFSETENSGSTAVYPIDQWDTDRADFPSNADVWNFYKNTNDQFVPNEALKVLIGNTPAPKGHFIIPSFTNRGAARSAAVSGATAQDQNLFSNTTAGPSALTTRPNDSELGRISVVASHAGRLFYAGNSSLTDGDANSPNWDETVFFSQLTKNTSDYGKCYQEADPTNGLDSTLVATDGGFFPIKNCGKILKMVSFGDNLLVFSSRGVWGVLGGSAGFTATDQFVYRITNFGIESATSVVETETAVFAWLETGIFVFTINSDSSTITATDISSQKIKTKLNSIPDKAKPYVQGVYDKYAKKIHWLYNNLSNFIPSTTPDRKNSVLVYDLAYNCFTLESWQFNGDAGPNIFGVWPMPFRHIVDGFEPPSIRYLSFQSIGLSGSSTATGYVVRQKDTSFTDWANETQTSSGGVAYEAFLLTQTLTVDDTLRVKRPNYLTVHCKRTEENFIDDGNGQPTLDNPSSCRVQARWDFSDSDNSGKFDTEFEAYRFLRPYMPSSVSEPFNYGQSVITTKNKIRGSGRNLVLRIANTQGKNLKLLGIGLTGFTQNNV